MIEEHDPIVTMRDVFRLSVGHLSRPDSEGAFAFLLRRRAP